MRKIISAILLSSSCLMACDSRNTDQAIEIQNVDSKHQLTAATPSLMRSIQVDSLSLTVKINDVETSYDSSDTEDGKWLIKAELAPNQTYDLLIKWYSYGYLVLEEFGTFDTPANGTTISPKLDYRSAGRREFDLDCDGFSNLEEIRNNTRFAPSDIPLDTPCDDPNSSYNIDTASQRLTDSERPVISQHHDQLVDSTNDAGRERVTSYDQFIKINRSSLSTDNYFFIHVYGATNGLTGDATEYYDAIIYFRQQFGGPKFMEATMNGSTAVLDTGIANQSCVENAEFFLSSASWICSVPYDWQEDRWYSIRLEESTPTTWNIRLLDQQTQITQNLGTFLMPENISSWGLAVIGIRYGNDVTRAECLAGLPQSSITFKQALANNLPLGSGRADPSDCLYAGEGWSAGMRTVDGLLEYRMTLGPDQ